MKIPKAFTLEKNLEESIKRLMNKPECEELPYLLASCGEFIKEIIDLNEYTFMYYIGLNIARKMKYTKEEVEGLSRTITDLKEVKPMFNKLSSYIESSDAKNKILDVDKYINHCIPLLGLYLSALVNNIITKHDIVILNPETRLTGLGAFLEKGTIRVKSESGIFTGFHMVGGKLIIEGNAGEYTGIFMKKGEIHVYGENFTTTDISPVCEGRIYHKNRLVWPK